MQNMYGESIVGTGIHARAAITRASAICNSCINLINAHMIRLGVQNGVRVIAGGYVGGQVPKDAAVLHLDPSKQTKMREAMVKRFVEHFGKDANQYFSLLGERGIDREPHKIAVVNPMLGLSVTEEEIIETLRPLGWERPEDTGITSTNCLLNDLGVYVHHKLHGFHPYIMEIAEQVRNGLMAREEALSKLRAVPRREEVSWQAEAIGLGHNDF